MSSSLRPSALPKLAVCPSFVGSPGEAGVAAQRGTLMDEAFRNALLHEGQDTEPPSLLIEGQATLANLNEKIAELDPSLEPGTAAVEWAVKRVLSIAGGDPVLAAESDLFVEVPHLDARGGTMDADIPAQRVGIDLKTGRIRNYREQMAAYALGRMIDTFESDYTMVLLFADARWALEETFTYDEADGIVRGIRDVVKAPSRPQVPCEYCNWCAMATTCQSRRELAERALAHCNVLERFELILDDPEELAQFIIGSGIVDEFREIARARAAEIAAGGVEVPGFSVVNKKGSRFMPTENLVTHLQVAGVTVADLVRATGSMSESKFLALMGDIGASGEPGDYNFAEGKSSSFIRKRPTGKK